MYVYRSPGSSRVRPQRAVYEEHVPGLKEQAYVGREKARNAETEQHGEELPDNVHKRYTIGMEGTACFRHVVYRPSR